MSYMSIAFAPITNANTMNIGQSTNDPSSFWPSLLAKAGSMNAKFEEQSLKDKLAEEIKDLQKAVGKKGKKNLAKTMSIASFIGSKPSTETVNSEETNEQSVSSALGSMIRASVANQVTVFLSDLPEGVDIAAGIYQKVHDGLAIWKETILRDEVFSKLPDLEIQVEAISAEIMAEYGFGNDNNIAGAVIKTPISIDPETPSGAIGIRKDGEFHAVPESALPDASKPEGGLSEEAIAKIQAFNKKD